MKRRTLQRRRRRPAIALALSNGAVVSRKLRSGVRGSQFLKVQQTEDKLATELYTRVRIALERFGVSAARQKQAWRRAIKLTVAPTASGQLLRDAQGLSELLLDWSSDERYLDAAGRPRVLTITGPGNTFEGLARRHLPKMPLKHVIQLIQTTSDVKIRPGGRIALLGIAFINLKKIKARPLAYAIRQIDQILETTLHNERWKMAPVDKGRIQRLVTGLLSSHDTAAFTRELTAQVANLLSRADASLRRRRPKTAGARRRATAISVGVYLAQETDLVRAGVDPEATADPGPRRRQKKARRRR